MTLKEFFLSVDFELVWPIVLSKDPEMADSGVSVKQAFDKIRLIEIEPEAEPKKNRSVSGPRKWL